VQRRDELEDLADRDVRQQLAGLEHRPDQPTPIASVGVCVPGDTT
jgi:hypothetical protein